MTLDVAKICEDVSQIVTPTVDERNQVLDLAGSLVKNIKIAAEKAAIKAEVRVEGSVAKGTWLSGEPDIDIFMRMPPTMPRDAFKTTCLKIAREATSGYSQIERFAEHPYLEAFKDSTRINIVPCYRVRRGDWMSATDRTPFHTDYVKQKLNDKLRCEIRLLKRFIKGIGAYGAEIRIGGFSGYLCELLILYYGSFIDAVRSVAEWETRTVIDYENCYKGREDEALEIFEEPLIVVDPVDKGRNAASAVRKERLTAFIAASREFLRSPSMNFFFPKEVQALGLQQLIQKMKARGSTLIFVKFGRVTAVPDILWGQLYKTQRSLHKMLERNDFRVIRDSTWSDEQNLNMLIFEVEHRSLPPLRRHLGPPIDKTVECRRFLNKHLNSSTTISGPRLEGDRWVVEIRRKHTDVVHLLDEKLKDGGRQVGVADLISRSIAKQVQILANEEIASLYSPNSEFAKFLTEYLDGKPRWLRKGS